MMRRRQVLTLLGGAVAAWPVAARAQQPALPVIGFLNPQSPEGYLEPMRAFRQGLKEAGYVEGENITIEYRWADNQSDRVPVLADELVRRRVALIVTTGGAQTALAAKAATTTIPIAFIVADDPVRLGLVASLARPGGNLTGVIILLAELAAKRLELLRELVPRAARIGVLTNPNNPAADLTLQELEPAARALGLQIRILRAGSAGEIDTTFAAFAQERPDALFVASDPLVIVRRVQLALLAAVHRIPAAFAIREVTEVGGLMSYGASLNNAYRQVGAYAGRILKGAKPSDLPVIQSSKFELVINHQTARSLGITVPPSLLALADEVIE
jgi:putative tryptophan/tyrosine transport system substrate-binding protein